MANERKSGKQQLGDSLEVNLREIVKQKLKEDRASEIRDVLPSAMDDAGLKDLGTSRRVKVPVQIQAQYFREISVLLQAGFPILRALRIAGRGKTSPTLSAAFLKVANQVENGTSLWRAMQSHSRIFPSLVVSIVRAGEASGTLDEALVYLADSLEYEAEVRLKVRSALDYPIFFAVLTLLVISALIFFVVPQFDEIYKSFKVESDTKGFTLLLDLHSVYPVILAVSGAVFAFFWVLLMSRKFMILEKLKLRIPIFGKILVYADMTRFAKTLAVQVKSSVPILEALRLSQLVVDNRELQRMVYEVRVSAEQGGQLAGPMKNYRVLPDTAVDMVEIGEESGALDVSLDHLVKMLQNSMESTISRLTALLQPILLLVMGGVVVGIFVMMVTPYLKVLEKIQESGFQPMGSSGSKATQMTTPRKPPVRVKVDKKPLKMKPMGSSGSKATQMTTPRKPPVRVKVDKKPLKMK